MNRRYTFRFIISLVMLVMMMCVTKTTSYAMTTNKSLTMIKGEEATYSFKGIGNLTKVTSSDSKVVKAQLVTTINGASYAKITARKKGTANVTCKGSNGNAIRFKFTVKNPNYSISVKELNGRAVVRFQNKLSFAYFEQVSVTATFRDSSGNEVTNGTVYLYCVGPNRVACEDIPLSSQELEQIDFSKTSFAMKENRSLNTYYSYKDVTGKMKYSVKKMGKELKVTVKIPKLQTGTVDAAYDLYFYDGQGRLLSVIDGFATLNSGKTSNSMVWTMPENAKSWKLMNKRAFMEYSK